MRLIIIGNANDILPHVSIPSFTDKPEHTEKEDYITFDKPPSHNWDNEELCKTPKWVQKNMRLGHYGEIIAKNFLNDQGINIIKKSDRKGYDLENKKNGIITGYEVKTASKYLQFFVSVNELVTAARMKKNYMLFFIFVHQDKPLIDGYIIPDPVKNLNLPLEHMLSKQNKKVIVTNANFRIELSEKTLKEFEFIDLTQWDLKKFIN